MATPSPDLPEAAPVSEPVAPAPPTGPTCAACDTEAVVHWRRRPTDDELAGLVAAEQSRRDQVLLLADPQLAAPVFPPFPTGDDMTRTVYACAAHAISLDAAARIHAGACSAPAEADLPGCDCTPEPLPAALHVETSGPELPAHWVTGGV
ncbi:hypothetical protein [Streptomyces sp. ME18-1-4]|uniref:hypothetical protein n=1 Tax=Streptomyces sp. ME18-1-4 TaxID=3028685 RepID=UPI0029AF64AA|nr:hypothetical protein [Streptomyces sp. ME18-1-4]MDX3245842.1 hypothetical protein [Streptomyces sp. ME18-1-4]